MHRAQADNKVKLYKLKLKDQPTISKKKSKINRVPDSRSWFSSDFMIHDYLQGSGILPIFKRDYR